MAARKKVAAVDARFKVNPVRPTINGPAFFTCARKRAMEMLII